MSYKIVEKSHCVWELYRHDVPRGAPNNAEFQFWMELEEAKSRLADQAETINDLISALDKVVSLEFIQTNENALEQAFVRCEGRAAIKSARKLLGQE